MNDNKILVVDDNSPTLTKLAEAASATVTNSATCVKCKEQVKDGEYYYLPRATTTGSVDVVCKRCAALYAKVMTWKRPTPKIGRNEPCRCGSGKKSKKCCGA